MLLTLVKNYAAVVYQLPLYVLLLPFKSSMHGLPYDSAVRLIPFVALVIVTPGACIKKRLQVIGLGMGVYLLMDLSSTLFWKGMPPRAVALAASSAHITYSLVWEILGHWVLPIAVWYACLQNEIISFLSPTPPAQKVATTI